MGPTCPDFAKAKACLRAPVERTRPPSSHRGGTAAAHVSHGRGVMRGVAFVLTTGIHALIHTEVILDSAATMSIIHFSGLLTDLRDTGADVIVSGVAGEAAPLVTSIMGELAYFGSVLFHEGASANILSLAEVSEMYPDTRFSARDRTFYVPVSEDITVEFRANAAGLYVADFALQLPDRVSAEPRSLVEDQDSDDTDYELEDIQPSVMECGCCEQLVACAARDPQPSTTEYSFCEELDACEARDVSVLVTASDNEKRYTKDQVERAAEAGKLIQRLGYPAGPTVMKMLRNGVIVDTDVTAHDVYRFYSIYGPHAAVLKGKSVHRGGKGGIVRSEYVPAPEVIEQTLFIDLMYVVKQIYLLSVSKPLHLMMINSLASRSTANVRIAIESQVAAYRSEGFVVASIMTDGEGAVASLRTELNAAGIVVNTAGSGQHVPEAERAVRTIKDVIRSVIAGLDYLLPLTWLVWVIMYAVQRVNMLPTTARPDMSSPREGFTGRKVSAKIDCATTFGEYALIPVDPAKTTNSMDARMTGAICLGITTNRQGSVQFFNLLTGKVVTRDRWTIVPTPAQVIAWMNALARDDPLPQLWPDTAPVDLPPADPPHGIVDPPTLPVPRSAVPDVPVPVPQPLDPSSTEGVPDPLPAFDDQVGAVEEDQAAAAAQEPEPADADAEEADTFLRRSSRSPKPMRHHDFIYHVSMAKALKVYPEQAREAIVLELEQMMDKSVFYPVHRSSLSNAEAKATIRSSLFLKEKFTSDGFFDKLKGRLVAGGNLQDKSLYADLSSPTVANSSVLIVLALAAREQRKIMTMDIGGAFLNANLEEVVHMRLDSKIAQILVELRPDFQQFIAPDGSMIVRLVKALYGCVESSLLWYRHLSSALIKYGFVANPLDSCVFNLGTGKNQMTVCLHVDDLLVTCKSQSKLDAFAAYLKDVYKEVKVNHGTKHSYLGMTIEQASGKIILTMERYVAETLAMSDTTGSVSYPAQDSLFTVDLSSEPLPRSEQEHFHSLVAKLLYLAKHIRPDMLTLCSFLATRVASPTKDDKRKLDYGMRYLRATYDWGMVLSAGKEGYVLTVTAHIDASYGVHADGKSHSGVTISVGAGSVFAKSSKQRIVVKSSTEAELVALSDACSQVLWTRSFLINQGYVVPAAIVYQDNQAALRLATNGPSVSDRTKHIAIRYYWMVDRVKSGELDIRYLPTGKMIADILTKPVLGKTFQDLRNGLLNWKDGNSLLE